MKKRELLKRIEELEAQVKTLQYEVMMLRRPQPEPYQPPLIPYEYRPSWWPSYEVWCGDSTPVTRSG